MIKENEFMYLTLTLGIFEVLIKKPRGKSTVLLACNREDFVNILGEVWDQFITPEESAAAAKHHKYS